jgi:NAD+ synthase (glutamine-hydrolysing)
MTILMALANQYGCLLIDTGNRTENFLGYATLYGDQAGAYAPLGDLNKMEVYEMGELINKKKGDWIPEGVFTRAPSAELSEGQVDPFDYKVYAPLVDELVDKCCNYEGVFLDGTGGMVADIKEKYPVDMVDNAIDLIQKSQFKRDQAPPTIRCKAVIENGD